MCGMWILLHALDVDCLPRLLPPQVSESAAQADANELAEIRHRATFIMRELQPQVCGA